MFHGVFSLYINHLGVLGHVSLETVHMKLCLPSDGKLIALIAGITSSNTMLGNYKKYMVGVALDISKLISAWYLHDIYMISSR